MPSTTKKRKNSSKTSLSEKSLVLCYENVAATGPMPNFYKEVQSVISNDVVSTSFAPSMETIKDSYMAVGACKESTPISSNKRLCSAGQRRGKPLKQKSPQVSFQDNSEDERSPLITKQSSLVSCSGHDSDRPDHKALPRIPDLVSRSKTWSGGMALQASAAFNRKVSSNSTSRLHSYHQIAYPKRHSAAACSTSDIASCGRGRLSLQPQITSLHTQGSNYHPNKPMHTSSQHADNSQNPLYEVSSDLMRMTGQTNPPFRKLLCHPSSPPSRDEITPVPTEVAPPDRLNGAAIREHTPTTIALVTPEDVENGVARAASKGSESTLARQSLAGPGNRLKSNSQPVRLFSRKQLFTRRTKLINMSMIVALVGIILMVVDNELTGGDVVSKAHWVSLVLRLLIVSSTLFLLAVIFGYHVVQLQLVMVDSGTDDWRVALSSRRLIQMVVELAVCAVCPLPGTGKLKWPYIENGNKPPQPVLNVLVPVDLILSIPMFLRLYLLGRYMVLHSRLFQDAATRSIAALNRINVDFNFVMKTLMHDHPLRVLISFTCCFWLVMSWLLTQCERYSETPEGASIQKTYNYLNSLWLVVITFMSVGYGDIVPHTYCGRGVAICTGIMGIGVASALVAVISRKLDLSKAEKHVNAFMADTKLGKQRKETAARVLQETWFIFKFRYLLEGRDVMRMRLHQRRFLAAIHDFRRVKWDQRKLAEQSNNLIDVTKVQAEVQDALFEMQENQQQLMTEVAQISESLSVLNETLRQTLLKNKGSISNFSTSPTKLTPNT